MCYCNATPCCTSHHETTAKFSSNPRISFSRKSTWTDPPAKSDRNKTIYVNILRGFFCTEVPLCCEGATKKQTFAATAVSLQLTVPLSLSTGTCLRRHDIPEEDAVSNYPAIHSCNVNQEAVPDLGLWRPLGNNVIEKSSTS